MVMVLDAKAAFTPAGKLAGTPMAVAPVVVCVMLVSGVLIHSVGVDEAALAVLFAVNVTVSLALAVNPLPSVTVTEYGVVEIGETIIEGVLAPVLHK